MFLNRLVMSGFLAVAPLALQAEVPAPQSGPSQLSAAVPAEVAALADTLMIGQVIAVMREEGIDYGATLEGELFPGRGGDDWQAVVGLIYDTAKMRARFEARFARELAGDADTIAATRDFFGSDRGRRILDLELQARRALMDDAAEEAAKVAVQDMIGANDPRMDVLRRFAETNDLIESNVAGALNSNLAFYKGLSEAGAFQDQMSEEDMLADVWSQEPDIRADTEEWLFSYLALAYRPLSEADMAAYQAFSETSAGQKLNAALFAAFDEVFTAISLDLGRAAARQMQGEDI